MDYYSLCWYSFINLSLYILFPWIYFVIIDNLFRLYDDLINYNVVCIAYMWIPCTGRPSSHRELILWGNEDLSVYFTLEGPGHAPGCQRTVSECQKPEFGINSNLYRKSCKKLNNTLLLILKLGRTLKITTISILLANTLPLLATHRLLAKKEIYPGHNSSPLLITHHTTLTFNTLTG